MVSASSSNPQTWSECFAAITSHFDHDDSSDMHARLRIPVKVDGSEVIHAAMVWHGKSMASGTEVVHVAAPIANVAEGDAVVELAKAADALPLGALRTMNEIVHVHESLTVGQFSEDQLRAAVRLIVTEAATLKAEA